MEQLLRTTDVRRIYVLMRGKRGCPATERLQRILYGGLFHLVRDDASLLSKVGHTPMHAVRVSQVTEFERGGLSQIQTRACRVLLDKTWWCT